MAKFATAVSSARSSLATDPESQTTTYEGAPAFGLTQETELLLLAANNLVGEHSFYQSAAERDRRYKELIHAITKSNPTFISGNHFRQGLASYLRNDLKMRSASIVLAAEYIRAGGANGRSVIKKVIQRADEPAELLAYWISNYGRKIPQPIKRGLADRTRDLYTESNMLRYNSSRHSVQPADVIELVHPTPKDPVQSQLFQYLLDRRHGRKSLDYYPLLGSIEKQKWLESIPADLRRAYILDNGIPLNWSWERLSGYVSPMDAAMWEAVIPNMGVMALTRNLRNFDLANISQEAINRVTAKIASKEDVIKSRIWPLNVFAGYKESLSDNYKLALATALDYTTTAIPKFDTDTLILVDVSGSMDENLSARSSLVRIEAAAIMGAAVANRTGGELYAFGTKPTKIEYKGKSTLQIAKDINYARTNSGMSTDTMRAIQTAFRPTHKRVIIFTDDQVGYMGANAWRPAYSYRALISPRTYLHIFDLAGYGRASTEFGQDRKFIYGGMSDSMFSLMEVLEKGHDAGWPF